MAKRCSKCRLEWPESKFNKRGGRRRGLQPYCKSCFLEWSRTPEQRARQRARSASVSPLARRASHLKSQYGLTSAQYSDLLASQDGRCANVGCRTDVPGGNGAFPVDHDHRSGKVRGLLCTTCNTGLGHLGDGEDPERIYGLYQYAVDHMPTLIGGPTSLFRLK